MNEKQMYNRLKNMLNNEQTKERAKWIVKIMTKNKYTPHEIFALIEVISDN